MEKLNRSYCGRRSIIRRANRTHRLHDWSPFILLQVEETGKSARNGTNQAPGTTDGRRFVRATRKSIGSNRHR